MVIWRIVIAIIAVLLMSGPAVAGTDDEVKTGATRNMLAPLQDPDHADYAGATRAIRQNAYGRYTLDEILGLVEVGDIDGLVDFITNNEAVAAAYKDAPTVIAALDALFGSANWRADLVAAVALNTLKVSYPGDELTADEKAAINNASAPSATNPLITQTALEAYGGGGSGEDGADGLTALVVSTVESAGANCTNGGQKVESGLDDNGDLTLDAGEVDQTSYVCNGVDGAGTDELTADEKAAINGAATPSAANVFLTSDDVGTSAATASTDYATAAQGALADSALQTITDADVPDTITINQATLASYMNMIHNDTLNDVVYPVFVDAGGGSQAPETDSDLTYVQATGTLSADVFNGVLASSEPDGEHMANIYNSIAPTFTPSVGDMYVDSSYVLQIYNGSSFSPVSGTDDQTAAEVAFTPTGTIAATDVQTAIAEVASEAGSATADDTAYAISWDGNTDAATKNVLYDKIETLSAGSAPTVQSADPTSASSSGFYCATTSGDCFYKSSAGLFNLAAGTYAADPTIPTLSSATIPAAGTTATLVFSESVTRSAATGFNMDCTSGTDITMTYASGSPSNTLVYTLGSTVLSTDSTSCNLDYASSSAEIASTDDSTALADITDGTVTNNSTASGGGVSISFVQFSSGVDVGGVTTSIAMPSGVSDGDLMIAVITADGAEETMTAPIGWTSLTDVSNGTSNRQWAFYRVADSDTGPYSFELSSARTTGGHIIAFSKSSGSWTAPTTTNYNNTSSVDSLTVETGSVTTTNGSVLLVAYGNDGPNTVATAPPGTATSVVGNYVSNTLYYEAITTGASMTRTLVWDDGGDVDSTSIAIVIEAK